MKSRFFTFLILVAGCWFTPEFQALGDTNVVVAYSTTNSTPLNIGFAGFTAELLGTGMEYGDTNMQHCAAQLSPGWLLFPGGTSGDAFCWSNELTETNWVNQIGMEQGPNSTASNLCATCYLSLLGKGGAWFTNFAAMAANLNGANIIVCINGFTDTNTSAGAFAAFALANHIHVAAWELCNEPYLFQGANEFFTNGTDYANKMLPYANAIKTVDSNAVIAVFFSDPARPGLSWDNDLSNYPTPYWNAVVYHHYPEFPTNSTFDDLMAMDNGVLFSNTTLYVTNILMPRTTTNMQYLCTEFNPTEGDGLGAQYPPTSTLYGGIYGAEYVMRLSTIQQMKFVGSYQLVNGSGVDSTNQFWNTVDHAATNNMVTNTIGLPFGYFLSAQGSAEAVAYWAINRSTAVYPTTVGTNCPIVPMDTNGIGFMPALYAQAYQGSNGKRYVLLTNKGTNPIPVRITEGGFVLTNQFLETYVTGADPTAVNSNPPTNNIFIETDTVTNTVMIPEYSVVRLEWTVLNVTNPVVGISFTNASPTLQWLGLSNVVYDVQSTTNLPTSWATVGKISSTNNNFSFTDPNTGSQRFYQLVVP